MDQSRLVSVIIPAYNVEAYIHRALESVINQTYENTESVVVDDGSTDNTWHVVQSYVREDKRIRGIRQANRGVSSARNLGMDMANGEYFVFLDADDWLEKDTVEKLMFIQAKCKRQVLLDKFRQIILDTSLPFLPKNCIAIL